MITQAIPQHSFEFALVESGICLIAFTVASFWPRIGAQHFAWVERRLAEVAMRPRLAVFVAGLSVILIRLAILPFFPIPAPFVHDDFSQLLAADTFASGRLTNPTPVMWTHFESFHITMTPTYMSMYFPGQGLLLAAGKVLFGHPWYGLLIAGALMCSAICWMLQAWLPPCWAFLGGMLAVLRLALFSYWMNTYTGAGTIAALGGALVLGALPRYVRSLRIRDGVLLAAGMILLMLSRPYEGMLLCIPVVVFLMRSLFRQGSADRRIALRSAVLPLALLILAGSWMAYYDSRVFGDPLSLPYTVNRATYAMAPYYVWQDARPEPIYRHAELRSFYRDCELKSYDAIHTSSGYLPKTLLKLATALLFYAGFALVIPLMMIRRAVMDRRIRFLVVCALVLVPGMMIQIFFFPHYVAPFTAMFYAIGLQCMRHLRVWCPGGRPTGLALVRASVILCIGLAAIRVFSGPLHIVTGEWPGTQWASAWYGPDRYGTERAAIQEVLTRSPGKQLALVRYAPDHNPIDEWVYNAPDIDASKVIWARDMDAARNGELIRYYHDRNVWLVQPDRETGKLGPYPGPLHE